MPDGGPLEPGGFEPSADPKAGRKAALEQSLYPPVFPEKRMLSEEFHPGPQGCTSKEQGSLPVTAPERRFSQRPS